MSDQNINPIDIIIIIGYFILVFGIVDFIIIRDKKKSKADLSPDYFLSGRNLGWFVIGASLFASNIGSEFLVGLAEAVASGDLPAAQFEIIAAFMLLLLGWLFVPFYIKSDVFTMPEFLKLRDGSRAGEYLSWVSIVAYIHTELEFHIKSSSRGNHNNSLDLVFMNLISIKNKLKTTMLTTFN